MFLGLYGLGGPLPLFLQVFILKAFKSNVFVSVHFNGVTGAFPGSADSKGVSVRGSGELNENPEASAQNYPSDILA